MADSSPLYAPVDDLDRSKGCGTSNEATRNEQLLNSRDTTELTATHRELTAILSSVLERDEIGLDDDFFAMGGTSIQAARFFALIQKRFGRKLPLTTILQDRTIRSLAERILDTTWIAPWSSYVALKESGSYPPFFLIHPISGNVVGYKDLAVSLSREQPVYALQAQGLDGESQIANSVEAMAAHYVEAMRTVQPSGPYFIGGWSAGGRVAFEMARQLDDAGEAAAIVVVFDAVIQTERRSLHGLRSSMAWISRSFYEFNDFGLKTFLRKKFLNFGQYFRIARFDLAQRIAKRSSELSVRLAVGDAFMRVLRQYHPRPLDVDLCVFRTRAAKHWWYSPDGSLGWSNLVLGELTIKDAPGNHDTILQSPNLEIIAKALDEILARARFRVESEREESRGIAGPLDPVPVSSGLMFSPFLDKVRTQPNHLAVVSGRRRLSYAQVYPAAAHLAETLRMAGAKANGLIPVVMNKGWEQVVAVLAIEFAGSAYLPIDPEWPADRRHHLLGISGSQVALTQADLASSLSWPDHIQPVPVGSDLLTAGPAPIVQLVQTPEDLAYVLFTSGSTGEPKGVMINHRGVLNTILDLNERYAMGSEDRVLALSSLTFDLSVYDIFGVLGAGGTIILPSHNQKRDPEAWLALMKAEQVTLWNSVPALFEMLLSFEDWARSCPSLRLVFLGGDWISLGLPGRVWKELPHVKLASLGGVTEASICSIIYTIEHVDPNWNSIPYGRAMKHQSVHVLDEGLNECPLLIPGEIYIGGIGLAKGYYKNDVITAERFFNHPRTGIRLYRTGDMGRYLPSGDIEFLGRNDLQVKVNGFRIELSEIEATLLKYPGVSACAAVVLGDRAGSKRLAACVVGEELNIDQLRNHLLGKLPEYMVPGLWKTLPSLPLTGNGKVDRKRLPELFVSEASPAILQ